MNVTRRSARVLLAGIAALSLAIAGCSGLEEALSGLTGRTSSKNRSKGAQKPIPSMMKSSAQANAAASMPSTQDAAAPQVEAPAAATKGPVTDAPEPPAAVAPADARSEPKPLRDEAQAYTATRNRDPFRSLISSDQERMDVVDLSVVTLVGIVWAHPDPFCIVEDAEGISFILRKGDAVKNGRIVAIHRDKLVASQTILGYTTTVQLTLARERGKTHG